MPEGFSVATANSIAAAMFQGVAFVWTQVWMQLHVGAPGPNGTANPAVDTTRIDVSDAFGTDPVDGEITNDAAIGPWPNATADEDYTHATLWSASSGGVFGASGQIAADPVTIGEPFTLGVGDFTAVYPTAS